MAGHEPLHVPIKVAAHLLGCCRQTLYKMRDDNQIAFGRMRGRTMVPMAEIKRVHSLLYPTWGLGRGQSRRGAGEGAKKA